MICPECGVELDEKMSECPLCNYSPAKAKTPSSLAAGEQKQARILSDFENLTRFQKRKLFWELSNIILLSGILVSLIINLVTAGGITWSKYTIATCLVLVANITLFSFWRHRLFVLLGGSFLSTSLLLVILDLYNEKMGWGTRLGIPMLFSIYMTVLLLTIVIRISKQHGFNILGWFFLAAGILAVCINAILSFYIAGKIILHWGLIVLVCMVPITAILFHIHYRLNRGAELRRFFHI